MSKLQILIPQYNEDDNMIKPMLDSIELQQNIDLKNDVEVFIGNDGSDTKLSLEFLKRYSFPIQYHSFEHCGLPGTRKKLFDLATADYVMFCDADDMFIDSLALSIIFQIMAQEFDALICTFCEEYHLPDGKIFYLEKENDSVFVHGKIYSRKFLLANRIEWHPDLHEHQDSCYNVLARTCAKKTLVCKKPIYLWKNNPNSISRKNGKMHLPLTWPHMLDSYDHLIDDLKERGFGEQARYYTAYALYATYYELSHSVWHEDNMEEYKLNAYKRLRELYYKYSKLLLYVTDEQEEKINKTTHDQAEKKGKLMEMPPFDEWFQNILKLI